MNHLDLLADLGEMSALHRVNRNLLIRTSPKREINREREVSVARTQEEGLKSAGWHFLPTHSLIC